MNRFVKRHTQPIVNLVDKPERKKKGYKYLLLFNIKAKGRARFCDLHLTQEQAEVLLEQLEEKMGVAQGEALT
jgi:hypothetical protein